MTNEKMERQLAAALEKTAPDDMSGVLSRCETRKGTVINMPTMKTAKENGRFWLPPAWRWFFLPAEAYSISRRMQLPLWCRWMSIRALN